MTTRARLAAAERNARAALAVGRPDTALMEYIAALVEPDDDVDLHVWNDAGIVFVRPDGKTKVRIWHYDDPMVATKYRVEVDGRADKGVTFQSPFAAALYALTSQNVNADPQDYRITVTRERMDEPEWVTVVTGLEEAVEYFQTEVRLTDNMLKAPPFHVVAGQVTHLGDYTTARVARTRKADGSITTDPGRATYLHRIEKVEKEGTS